MFIGRLLLFFIFLFSCEELPIPESSNDCNEVQGGTAFLDDCDSCVGGNTGLEINYLMDCNGVCEGNSVLDDCGECDDDPSNDCIAGCIDESACNYNADANTDDESCEYAEENYDCDGNCLVDLDCNGNCNGDAYLDDCGFCDNNPSNDCLTGCTDTSACNYNPNASANDGSCQYASDIWGSVYFDCDGNCLVDIDCSGACNGYAYIDECGICDSDSSNDCVIGCTDNSACNYNPDATASDSSCEYAEENFDCDGNCLINVDCSGQCGGDAYIDECGFCDNNPSNDCLSGCTDTSACNYNPDATASDDSCVYPEENFDCSGNCLIDTDCDGECGGDAYIDECGQCDNNSSNDCLSGCTDISACNYDPSATIDNNSCQYAEENYDCDGDCVVGTDCAGQCNGDAYVDECGFCDSNPSNDCVTGCTDASACNYSPDATANDNSCEYPEENYDCDGDCVVGTDCAGQCNGDAYVDECGFCDNNTSNDCVTGCTDTSACNYNPDATANDGSCFYSESEYSCDCYNEDGVNICDFLGCMDTSACNYDPSATIDDNSCEYAEQNFDCNGNCLVSTDCAGQCDGDAYLDSCGFCDNDSSNDCVTGCTDTSACNYDPNADANDGSCEYASDIWGSVYFDCDGNCLVDIDCSGTCNGDAYIDDCGFCDDNSLNDCVTGCTDTSACNYNPDATANDGSCEYAQENFDCDGNCLVEVDCAGQCNGDAYLDSCGFCDNDSSNDCVAGCTDTSACNYNPNASANDGSCEYASDIWGSIYFDCDGNCLVGSDCAGQCNGNAYVDECGFCDDDSSNDCVIGCTDNSACNYNPDATANDGSCEYAEENFDCNGDCLVEVDCTGECNGDAYLDDCGFCDDDSSNDCITGCTDTSACNYDPNATANDGSCEYVADIWGSIYFDCDGNCLVDIDCNGDCNGDAYVDECGFCDSNPSNDCVPGCMDTFACNYNPDATANDGSCEYAEENFDCDGDCLVEVDCSGECGGDAYVDECGVCEGDNACFECDELVSEANNELEDIFYSIYNDPEITNCYENLGENPWCIDQLIDFETPLDKFEEVLTSCPNDIDANFGHAMLTLMSIINNGDFLHLMEKWSNYLYGFESDSVSYNSYIPHSGIGIYPDTRSYTSISPNNLSNNLMLNTLPPLNILTNNYREEIPELEELQTLIENEFLYRLEESIESIEDVVNNDYSFLITGRMQGDVHQESIQMDDTEFYIIKSYLHLFNSIFHAVLTYNVSGVNAAFDDYSFMNQDSDFLTIRPGFEESTSIAYSELNKMRLSMLSSISFLENETDWQGNDYFPQDVLNEHYNDVMFHLDLFNDFIYEDYTVHDEICTEINCENANTGTWWDIECECTEIELISTVINISNFAYSPAENLKEHVPAYSIQNGQCGLEEYSYVCPKLTWEATSYEEWYSEWSQLDYSVNGLFPEIEIDDVINVYFQIFNVDESSWSQTIGGN